MHVCGKGGGYLTRGEERGETKRRNFLSGRDRWGRLRRCSLVEILFSPLPCFNGGSKGVVPSTFKVHPASRELGKREVESLER